ncbi:hypothetical protein HDU85_001390 [Gaertneriomyces sp. JEL0708]|nr:hypothetical protein HDU85_001390 [Gaertneriomyces sp. JEL0708]
MVAMESQQYKDIMLLPCEENMNGGKTYHYFKYVADTFGDDRYDFVMKGDDDVWWHLPNLEKRLSALPRLGTYFGREPQKTGFMAGMGYAVSWDIVRWIGQDPYPAEHTVGQEDSVFANWLHHGKKIKNWEAEDNELYDDPASGKGWAHEYTPGTIGIHRLKDEALFLNCTWHFMADLK